MEKIKIITGTVSFKGNDKFGVTRFDAEYNGNSIPCQVLDWGAKEINKTISENEGNEIEVASVEEKPPYGWTVKLAKAGGGGGRGGFGGGPKGYAGQKFTVQKFLEVDKAVSNEFLKHLQERCDSVTPDAAEEIVRSRISQFWILVAQNVIEVKQ